MSNRDAFFYLVSLLFAGLLVSGSLQPAHAQQEDDDYPRFDLSGFLKVDAFYDTRQTVSAREGEFLLYPSPVNEQPEEQGDAVIDINGRDNLNVASFYSRLRLGIAVPEVLGAETQGVVEGDFLGTTNGLENMFRLRHAFVRMDWDTHDVVLGQYWSPMFVPEVFPRTVSFNLGVPMQPLARFPQARLTVHPHDQLSLVTALSIQRDAYQDIAGRETQQQAGLPGAHLHAQFSSASFFAGMGGYLRTVRPSLSSERFTSGGASVYARFQTGPLTLRTHALYGTNMADHLMLGGYARTVTDDEVGYHNLRTLATWADLSTTWNDAFTLGLFGGYTSSQGTADDLPAAEELQFQARGPNLDYVWRVSPRASYSLGNVRFSLELESTTALYAGDYSSNLQPQADGADPVTNVRLLFATFLFF